MCTELTHPSEHPDSRCLATIPVNTKLDQSWTYITIIWYLWHWGTDPVTDQTKLFFNQRKDPEHVMTAPELPCSGKLVRGRQDPENNERGSEPFCTQVTGAYIQEHFSICGTSLRSIPSYTGNPYKSLHQERSSNARKELDYDSCRSLILNRLSVIQHI